jgi:pimeloyl-ACP methyl ester carboxylesterase
MRLFNSSCWNHCWQVSGTALVVSVMLASFLLPAQAQGKAQRKAERKECSVEHPTFYRTTQIDGLSIFYREAGPKDGPTLLLLHGLPSSSRMFEPLFARLSDRYHLVAPDYPGFGHSDWPDPKKFAYTFDHIAEIMNHLTEALGLSRYTLYMQDYGGPVGFRMVLAHPERIEALIVQDAVAHNTGLGENWKTRRAFWADRTANESALRTNLLSLAAARARHVGDDPNVERHDPDLWTDEFYFLNQPGQGDIQVDLFYDYRTNVEDYPKWQAWMREKQPRLLVIWGKYEASFDPSEPESYRRDVPKAEIHIVDGGHFALDTATDLIAQLVRGFMK